MAECMAKLGAASNARLGLEAAVCEGDSHAWVLRNRFSLLMIAPRSVR